MKNKYKIQIIVILLIIMVISVIYVINMYRFESENIKIDEYNFAQLEKVKMILDSLDNENYDFFGIDEFNKNFNQNIEPIKNCYYIWNSSWFFENNKSWEYMFGFMLESKKYIMKYWDKNYAYPKYNLPEYIACDSVSCDDWNLKGFKNIISNPCEEQ